MLVDNSKCKIYYYCYDFYRYTQRGGRRPFGVCAFICGMDGEEGHLFVTDPAGIVSEWRVLHFCAS